MVGCWAAAMAHAEVASIVAFMALHDELRAHGAPEELVHRCIAAMFDEVGHAQLMARIANRHGLAVTRPRFAPMVVRDLEAIARENAVEGCVRETWAALEATYQARAALDSDVRYAMEQIALDETRHAELAHDIDAWLRTQLGPHPRARVDRARRNAVTGVMRDLEARADTVLQRRAGLPSSRRALQLANRLFESLLV